MHMNTFFKIFGLIAILSGCAPTTSDTIDWFDGYDATTAGTPTAMQYGRPADEYGTHQYDENDIRRMAVLLPTSGPNGEIGKTIRTSVETAVLQQNRPNLYVSFYDTATNPTDAINGALSTNPEIIIGPLFADNARILRDTKPTNTPALTFTSDATAVGNGVITMALMPTNSVETIVKQMRDDNVNGFIILAPDNQSGHLMAGTAKNAASINNVNLRGIFYYTAGDANSIKDTSQKASLNASRTAANNRACEILGDILTNERLTALEYSNLNAQLEKISRTDTLGKLPYNAILFLGNADDTKKLASFLRYFGVNSRDASYYGTAMWDGTDITSDITMTGAKYAVLPAIDENFAILYETIYGATPNRLATIGYDATNMAIGMIYSDKSDASYLLDPSGYVGTDGLFRLKPTGDNERGLRIVKINGDGTTSDVRSAPINFIKPIYNIEQRHIVPAPSMDIESTGINPNNYIRIPERFVEKYKSKTYGANITHTAPVSRTDAITILPEDDRDPITVSEFTPVKLESVNRSYIDEIEIEE